MPDQRGDRPVGGYWDALVRFAVPAQPVDATPSNALIRQCFPRRSVLFCWTRSKPSQGSVPADLTLASDLAFVFNASGVRPKCCVDPLRPPDLPRLGQVFGGDHSIHYWVAGLNTDEEVGAMHWGVVFVCPRCGYAKSK
jgi:hypothetical protein